MLITFLILMFFSAFFSGSETAFFSLGKVRYHQIKNLKKATAQRVVFLLSNPDKLIVTILIGNTIVNIASSCILASFSYSFLGERGVLISIFVMLMLVLIFGEVTPKKLALMSARRFALITAFPMHFFQYIFAPFRAVINWIATGLLKTFGFRVRAGKVRITEQEIMNVFSIGEEKGVVKGKERDMIESILRLKDLNAADIMTPRINLVALDMSGSREEIIANCKEGQYSRLPVYVHSLDNIVGVIHTKDFLMDPNVSLGPLVVRPFFVPESMKVDDILHALQKRKLHLAIVTDEYGVTSGVVTVEDILEEIVGEIRDERDFDEQKIRKVDKNTFEVSGQAHINEVNEDVGMEVETEEVDTIGGYVILMLGKIPQAGDKLELDGFVITVGDVSKNRITSLRIVTTEAGEE